MYLINPMRRTSKIDDGELKEIHKFIDLRKKLFNEFNVILNSCNRINEIYRSMDTELKLSKIKKRQIFKVSRLDVLFQTTSRLKSSISSFIVRGSKLSDQDIVEILENV